MKEETVIKLVEAAKKYVDFQSIGNGATLNCAIEEVEKELSEVIGEQGTEEIKFKTGEDILGYLRVGFDNVIDKSDAVCAIDEYLLSLKSKLGVSSKGELSKEE